MEMMNWLRIAGLTAVIGIVFSAGWKSGAGRVQAKWDRAENLALTEQALLTEQAERERDVLSQQVRMQQISLEAEELKTQRLSDEIQNLINREPVTRTVVAETTDGVCECDVPDTAQHFRLFNCGISNNCPQTSGDSPEASFRDGPLSRADLVTSVDGVRGLLYNDSI
jgi:hypothetical protein